MFTTIKELRQFLDLCSVPQEKQKEFLEHKQLISTKLGTFLSQTPFNKQEKAKGLLLSIALKKTAIAKPFLIYLKQHSPNSIKIKTEKQALAITYNKPQEFRNLQLREKLDPQKYYIFSYQNKVLGLGKVKQKQVEILYSLGDYLREQ